MSYPIDNRNLYEIRSEIKTTIIAKLEEAQNGLLSDINSIIYGDRMDVTEIDNMPVIWILPVAHQPNLVGGHTAVHDFAFNFIVMAHDMDSEFAREQAEDLSAKVYDTINAMRRTKFDAFMDVRPVSFDASYEAVANSSIYWASCEFVFRIQRRE